MTNSTAITTNEEHFPDDADEAIHGIVWEFLNDKVMTMRDAVGSVEDIHAELNDEVRWFAHTATLLLDDEFFIDDEAEELTDLVTYALGLAGIDPEGDPH